MHRGQEARLIVRTSFQHMDSYSSPRTVMNGGGTTVLTLEPDDAVAVALVVAIRTGDVDELRRLLGENPDLASARITGRKVAGGFRTPLHVVTDWPGYFPCGPQIVRVLIDAGADPSAPSSVDLPPSETPLHWAASSDDVEVAAALIDGGANIEVMGASIAGGPPLDCAVGYGCWHVARLLVARGARVDRLWHAAALGMIPRIKELQDGNPRPTPADITDAFWQACHGGQRRTAEYLMDCGADINTVPDYSEAAPLDIAGSLDTRRDTLVTWLRQQGAKSAENSTAE
jgi:ankyrin repeat protein